MIELRNQGYTYQRIGDIYRIARNTVCEGVYMNKYCKFNQDIYDQNNNLVFRKDEKYLVTYETDDSYYFHEYKMLFDDIECATAIDKNYEGELFEVVYE